MVLLMAYCAGGSQKHQRVDPAASGCLWSGTQLVVEW